MQFNCKTNSYFDRYINKIDIIKFLIKPMVSVYLSKYFLSLWEISQNGWEQV